MMLGVWFTFGPDGPALIESVAAFRAAGGKHVAIFDEAKNPIAAETLALIAPDYRESTTYPRNGNLNGWDNMFGQLDCMERACLHFGCDGAAKIDSDTLVLDLDWINPESPMSGFMTGGEAYLFGLAYHLRLDAIRAIRASMLGRYRGKGERLPEDRAISQEAFWLFGQQLNVTDWGSRRAGGWDYGRTPAERYAKCAIITFGNRNLAPNCSCQNERREKVALAMADYRKNGR